MNTNHFMNRFQAISYLFRGIVFYQLAISGPKQPAYSQNYPGNDLAISTDYTQG
ncbi:MAG TPA: hypothetical protein HA304_05560 [Methanosarcinales archaeon]|nr:hypothetical protein [Methanosarcinales archaeon]